MDGHSAETAKTTDTLSQASADDRLARDFRGFGPLGIVTAVMIVFTANLVFSNMVTVPVGAVLALVCGPSVAHTLAGDRLRTA
jgi:multisubunit Na+/H+ antiporter MnhG subunit